MLKREITLYRLPFLKVAIAALNAVLNFTSTPSLNTIELYLSRQ
jgi:hypothetical protein